MSARLDERFDRVDDKIDSLRTDIYARFKWICAVLGIGFTIISALIIIFQFVK